MRLEKVTQLKLDTNMKKTSLLLFILAACFTGYSILSSHNKMDNKIRSDLRARVDIVSKKGHGRGHSEHKHPFFHHTKEAETKYKLGSNDPTNTRWIQKFLTKSPGDELLLIKGMPAPPVDEIREDNDPIATRPVRKKTPKVAKSSPEDEVRRREREREEKEEREEEEKRKLWEEEHDKRRGGGLPEEYGAQQVETQAEQTGAEYQEQGAGGSQAQDQEEYRDRMEQVPGEQEGGNEEEEEIVDKSGEEDEDEGEGEGGGDDNQDQDQDQEDQVDEADRDPVSRNTGGAVPLHSSTVLDTTPGGMGVNHPMIHFQNLQQQQQQSLPQFQTSQRGASRSSQPRGYTTASRGHGKSSGRGQPIRVVPQSTEKNAWGVAADANAEYMKPRVTKWKSEKPDGPEDGQVMLDDDSGCKPEGICRPHGACRKGKCVCVVSYTGAHCKIPKQFPRGLTADFSGNFIITRKHVVQNQGVNFTTNPKAGAKVGEQGRTHTLFAPLVESEKKARLMMKYNSSSTVITPSMLKDFDTNDLLTNRIYDRCAIVGSSGLSMIYHDGPAIDRHDAVIRFNSAPTRPRMERGFQAVMLDKEADFPLHVGQKTTFRLINTQHIPWYEGNELRLQQLQSKTGLFRFLQYKHEHPEAALHAFDTDFTKYVSRNIVNLPTGGYFAIMLALQKCRRVNIYGFHWLAGHAIPHHYFNSEVPLQGKDSIHDYATEYENIKALAQQGLVHLAQPCVAGCEAESGIKCTMCAPGSTCGCGDNLPTPLSLPGFCHMKRNYTCFYKCNSVRECPGGAKKSRCLKGFDPDALGLECATIDQIPPKLLSKYDMPWWARPKWDPTYLAGLQKSLEGKNLRRRRYSS